MFDRIFIIAAFIAFIPFVAHAAFDESYVGDETTYRAKYEDTFVHLARDFGLGFTEMRAANPGVDPWVPGRGKKLILPTRHLLPQAPKEGIVINLPEMRLYAFVNGDEPPETYPIGVGREGLNTPIGRTKVVRKKAGPTWTPTQRMRREDPELDPHYPPGPDNPLGTHAIYLGWPTYAIHGTNRPFGIGRRISSGCIRLYPEAIIELYDRIRVGTKVTVVDQAIKAQWINDRLYIEAHPDIEQVIEMEETGVVKAPKLSDDDLARIIKVAGTYKDRIRWPAVRTAVRERRGYPVEIARRPYKRAEKAGESEEEKTVTGGQKSKAERKNEAPGKDEIKQAMNEIYGPGEDAASKDVPKEPDKRVASESRAQSYNFNN